MLLAAPGRGEEPVLRDGAGVGPLPLVCLATAATVIASQALITAAFSVTKQAIQLGFLPRLRVLHTSVRETGPDLRAVRQLGPVRLHRASRSCCSSLSRNLASAYGIAVTTRHD